MSELPEICSANLSPLFFSHVPNTSVDEKSKQLTLNTYFIYEIMILKFFCRKLFLLNFDGKGKVFLFKCLMVVKTI